MSSTHIETLVSGIKLSSVVPSKITGDNKLLELTNMDLATKLHYIKALYFFNSDAVKDLDIYELKKPMFHLLHFYYPAAGRIRRSENGRPVIKCNDSGVRIVEARCDQTLDELLAVDDCSFNDRDLTYGSAIDPDFGFSPLVFVQFTRFKCGGLSVGLSWAHVLGDAFSASSLIKFWAQLISSDLPLKFSKILNTKIDISPQISRKPLSLKKVESMGDHWVTPNNCKMQTHSLHISSKNLNNLLSNFSNAQPFEAISAIFWKLLSKIRGENEPKVVTICSNCSHRCQNEIIPSNSQIVSTVKTKLMVSNSNVLKLAKLILEEKIDENGTIEGLIVGENEQMDFVVYGGNLTFVNLEELEIYGVELKGEKPIFANYFINGVGDEGVILVLPAPKNYKNDSDGGRILTMVLPEHEIPLLKHELKLEWGIF